MIRDIEIKGEKKVGALLTVEYVQEGEGEIEFQWYRNGEIIEGETTEHYTLKIIDQTQEIICALWCDGKIYYSDSFIADYYDLEVKPIEKQYIYKLYNKEHKFLKVIQTSIITSDIQFLETINSGQGQLSISLNLPIDTDYLDDVKYLKVYMNDNNGIDNDLLFQGYLSSYTRKFSNNKENIQAVFLSIYSLLSDITYKDQYDRDTFSIENKDPAEIVKSIIDYFSQFYPGILTYTEESIVDYGYPINIDCNNQKCSEVLNNVMDGLTSYLFIGADGIVNFKPKPTGITHYLTYGKDITSLTIPESYEEVVNAVRVQYGYLGGPHTGLTSRKEDPESIAKFGRKEETVVNTSIAGNDSAEIYRDSYLAKNSTGKQNINLTLNNKYQFERIHPGDTIGVRNLNFEIWGLQVYSIQYAYEQATLKLEYQSSLGKEILNLTK